MSNLRTTTATLRAWNSEHDAGAAASAIELVTAEWADINLGLLRVLELDAGAGLPLVFEKHKRGNNWVAVLTGKNAANVEKSFRRYQNRLFDYSSLSAGDVLEIGADYTTSGGNKQRYRIYVLAVFIDDDRFAFIQFDTAAQAMRAARYRRDNLERIAVAEAAEAEAAQPNRPRAA